MSMSPSTTATYPDGHDVDGSAANAHTGAIARTNTIIRFIVAPISQKVNQTAQTASWRSAGCSSHRTSRKTGRKNRPTRPSSCTPSATRRGLSFYTNSVYYHHLLIVLLPFGRLNCHLYCCIFLYRLSVCLPRLLYT